MKSTGFERRVGKPLLQWSWGASHPDACTATAIDPAWRREDWKRSKLETGKSGDAADGGLERRRRPISLRVAGIHNAERENAIRKGRVIVAQATVSE